MTVSVIIPAHRLDAWLDEAVASVLASRDVDLELIVVLNGTPMPVAPSWSERREVTLIHTSEALGPTRAMIRGIAQSRSEYLARLDADDRMMPERLRKQVDWLESHPGTALVGTATRRIAAHGQIDGAIRMPTGADVRRSLVLFNSVPHSSVMIRRAALEAVGGYNPALAQMEDYDVILRLGTVGSIAVLPDELTEYRVHAAQTSRGAKPYGLHIREVGTQRRRLGRAIGMSCLSIAIRATAWRAIQFTRYYGATRPGHEY